MQDLAISRSVGSGAGDQCADPLALVCPDLAAKQRRDRCRTAQVDSQARFEPQPAGNFAHIVVLDKNNVQSQSILRFLSGEGSKP